MCNKRRPGRFRPLARGQRLHALRLLVCMLPYLFFAFMSGGLHTHDLANAGLSCTHNVTHGGFAAHDHSSHDAAITGHSAINDVSCLACEWSAGSASILSVTEIRFSSQAEAPRAFAPHSVRWNSRSEAAALGRGPPVV